MLVLFIWFFFKESTRALNKLEGRLYNQHFIRRVASRVINSQNAAGQTNNNKQNRTEQEQEPSKLSTAALTLSGSSCALKCGTHCENRGLPCRGVPGQWCTFCCFLLGKFEIDIRMAWNQFQFPFRLSICHLVSRPAVNYFYGASILRVSFQGRTARRPFSVTVTIARADL